MLVVLYKVISLFIPIAVGFLLKKKNVLKDDFVNQLSRITYLVFLPLYIIDNMNYEFSYQALLDSISLVISSVTVIVFGIVISFLFSKFTYDDLRDRSMVEFALTYSNCGFMGIPVMGALMGERGVFLASMHNIGYFIFMNSVAIIFINRDKFDKKNALKSFVNVPTFSVLIGFLIFLFNIKLPTVVADTVSSFAVCAPTLSMLVSGIVLANCDVVSMWKNLKLYIVSVLRLIVIPLIVFVVMYFLQLDGEIIKVTVMIAAMPVAVQGVLYGEQFKKNSALAAQSVAMSTIISLATIPLLAWFLERIV